MRAFAAHFPEDTAALVLLDPAHEHQLDLRPDEVVDEAEQAAGMARIASWLARLGLFRLTDTHAEVLDDLPSDAARDAANISVMARYWRSVVAEIEGFDVLAAAASDGFGDRPVRIISAQDPGTDGPEVRRAMDDLHRDLASRSPQASYHTIPGADHVTLLTTETDAAGVSEVILELLEELAQR